MEEEIRKTWRQLLIPFITGVLILAAAVLFYGLGSKKPAPQTIALLVGVFGALLSVSAGIRIWKFRKYLRKR